MAASTSLTLALAGDTMLGRGVGERLGRGAAPSTFVSDEIVALMAAADLRILNLECCISEHGTPWPAVGKPFFFRAPPAATDLLAHLGVDLVTLANNHALDYGFAALTDTFGWLERAGIGWVGAGVDLPSARRPAVVERGGLRVAVVGVADHPADFAATTDRSGIAHAELASSTPGWLTGLVAAARTMSDLVVVTPHWGPNMNPAPLPYVRRAAADLVGAGAGLVAGHSAHVFQGVAGPVLYDLGDFLDDYAIDPDLRNDLGLLWLVTVEDGRPVRLEAIPLHLGFCATGLATGDDARWIGERLAGACAALGSRVDRVDGRLVVALDQAAGTTGPR